MNMRPIPQPHPAEATVTYLPPQPDRVPTCDYEMDVSDYFMDADPDFEGEAIAHFDFLTVTPIGRGWYSPDDATLIGFSVDGKWQRFEDMIERLELGVIKAIELRGCEIICDLEVEA